MGKSNIKQAAKATIKTTRIETVKETKVKKEITTIKGVTWNVDEILEGQTFDVMLKSFKIKTESFKKYRASLDNDISVEKFYEILKSLEEIHLISVKLQTYVSLRAHENTKDADALAKLSQLKQVSTEISNELMFFTLWFMQLDDKIAQKIIDAKILEKYVYYLKEVRKLKPYTKSEEIERLLNIKDTNGIDAFSDIYDIITNGFIFEMNGKKLTEEEIKVHVTLPDAPKRKEAYDLILAKHAEHSTVLSELYKDTVIEWYNDGIKIRGYKSPINIRNVSNDISDKAVEALLNTVRKNTKIFSDYFKIKYQINIKNGQKYPYSRYHIYAPFPLKLTKKYDYEISKKMVLEVYKEFDPRFYANALKVFNSGHIHSHPQKNKRGGAFCMAIHTKTMPYMMLNHTDALKDVFTMVHELGHCVHYVFAEDCTELTYHMAIPLAETASVFSEMLLAKKLLRESESNAEKMYVLIQSLDNQFATIIRQSYFTVFEKFAHEKVVDGVNTDVLNEKWYETLKEQFRDMDIPENFKHEWLYVSHLFNSPYYCYAYVWGNLFVLSLYDMYKKDGKKFVDNYIELLSAGGSDSPANLMKKLGVDPESEEFWQRGFNIIKEEIEELKKLAK